MKKQIENPQKAKIIALASNHINTLSNLCCYTSAQFSIRYTGDSLDVYNKDNVLIETTPVTDDLFEDFKFAGYTVPQARAEYTLNRYEELKDKYILDYDNRL